MNIFKASAFTLVNSLPSVPTVFSVGVFADGSVSSPLDNTSVTKSGTGSVTTPPAAEAVASSPTIVTLASSSYVLRYFTALIGLAQGVQ